MNTQLKFDLEKYDWKGEVRVKIDYDDMLDSPYIIEVNDTSYFYTTKRERNKDFNYLLTLIKN